MAGAIETREVREAREDREEFEARIAKGFGHSIRVRIMECLNEEDASAVDLSPKIGVPSSNLSYHFSVLEECECIELVTQVPVRGAQKNVYTSLQPTLFADLAWATLSPHVRAEISQTMLRNSWRRLRDALQAATFDAKDDRHLSLQTVSVDWTGWDQLRELMAQTMGNVAEIELGSAARTGEQERFPATAMLLSYESPRMYEKLADAEAREDREEFEARIAKGFGHSLRVRIMECLNEEDASAAHLSRKIGESTSNLSYHLGVLEECECIERVTPVPVRCASKNVFTSLQPTLFADLAWATLSPHVRAEISQTMLRNSWRRLRDALQAATFDAKDDRHLSLQTVSVDWTGWDQLRELMAQTMGNVAEIELGSAARTGEQERFPATAMLLSYESPRMYEKLADG
jgi:DNA-binding transcriptional ArsR family regulator